MSNNHVIPRSRLLTRTLELLRDRPAGMTIAKIAKDTGIKESWLTYFTVSTTTPSASVDRIEVLYEYLTNSKLELH